MAAAAAAEVTPAACAAKAERTTTIRWDSGCDAGGVWIGAAGAETAATTMSKPKGSRTRPWTK